jgi:hypothetical protein
MPFIDRKSGKPVNAIFKRVNHPGTKPKPWLIPAWQIGKANLVDEIKRQLKTVKSFSDDRSLKQALYKALLNSSNTTIVEARSRVAVSTGQLRDSIVKEPVGELQFRIGTRLPHGRYLEYGTRPHQIFPRRAKALAFYWPRLDNKASNARGA